jgi:hypothetical protein
MIYNIDTAFSPMFAIQLVAFLMTLVKKGILSDSISRLIYSLSLWINLLCLRETNITFLFVFILSVIIFKYLRMKYKISKYIVWSIIFSIIHFMKDVNLLGQINESPIMINEISLLILIRFLVLNHFILYKF